MDLKKLIAQASAPHMQAVAGALENLRDAMRASEAAGFRAVFSIDTPPGEAPDARMALDVNAAARILSLDSVTVRLEYKATIQERSDA